MNWRIPFLLTASLLAACLLSACGGKAPSPEDDITPAQGQRVLKDAYSQVGKKYRYGGTTPSRGFDCSGLVYWAYRKNGLDMPRITREQARIGRSISRSQARPGDILVFRTGLTSLHTGLYAGKNTFIHSPRAGRRIEVESMDIPYWRRKLIGVRRVSR